MPLNDIKKCRCWLPWTAAILVGAGAVILIRELPEAGRSAERSWWAG